MTTTRKAIAGAIAAAAASLLAVLTDGALSGVDVIVLVAAAATGYLGVYFAPPNDVPGIIVHRRSRRRRRRSP